MEPPTEFDRERKYGLRTPPAWLKFLEVRALLETGSLLPASPWLLAQPRGDGRKIVVVPGFLTDDRVTAPLRTYLKYLGYDVLGWGLGRNNGGPERDAQRLVERLSDIRNPGQPITLIGWSLGGVIARESARLAPQAVGEVITYGTPVEGGPKYTATGESFARRRRLDLDEFERHVHSINSRGIGQPLTVIYSRGDGIVGWRAAIDRYNPQARHISVAGSHIGLGTNPLVWRVIARTLAGIQTTKSDELAISAGHRSS